jgi:hypothetical protein
MQILFIALAIYGTYFFIIGRSQFDFVSAGFFGQLIYFIPGFYGFVTNPYFASSIPSIPIFTETYTVWDIALASTIVAGSVYRPARGLAWPRLETNNAFDLLLIFVIVFSLLAELYLGGGAFLSEDKNEVLQNATRFSLLFGAATQIGLIAFAAQGKFGKLMVPLAGVALLLYAGFRNDFSLAAIALATFVAQRKGVLVFARPHLFLILLSFVGFVFMYKGFLGSYRADRWASFYASLDMQTFVQMSFLNSEPFLTQSLLNEVLIRDLSMPPSSILYALFAGIPLVSPFIGIDQLPMQFNFQEQLFPNLTYGVASNIYAYFYSTLGWAGILFFILAHCVLLVFVSRWMGNVNSSTVRLGLMSVGAYLAFFIHRNDLTNALLQMNRPIIAIFVVWILSRYLDWPMRRRGIAPLLSRGADGSL